MKKTLQFINRMVKDGVIERYAIGGAVGATFYLEPAATVDIDIFVVLPGEKPGALVSLSRIYEYVKEHGYKPEKEHIVIADWPVQFLSIADTLDQEALDQAREVKVEGVMTWVIRAEYLSAIALRTGREKDHTRVQLFLVSDGFNMKKLLSILRRHKLMSQWMKHKAIYEIH